MYINETRSNIRRTTIIRESSLISPLSVLLFSNKKLRINLVCITLVSEFYVPILMTNIFRLVKKIIQVKLVPTIKLNFVWMELILNLSVINCRFSVLTLC